MASKAKSSSTNAERDAAVEYFSARSHNLWRKTLLKTNPEQKGQPRMRMRGGVMVDVNQPWDKLHPKAQADNKRAARDAYMAVKKFPDDREAAAAYVHACWIKRNKKDASQPKALFKPYAKLPEVEKDKDRVHVDTMRQALAAVRKSVAKTPPRSAKAAKAVKRPAKAKSKAKTSPGLATIQIDAAAFKRLQAAAKQLSKALGRDVPADVLLKAGVEAMTELSRAMAAQARAKDV